MTSELGDPTPERGGNRKRHYRTRTGSFHPLRGLSLDLTAVLRRSPGYAAIAVLSLAMGIGPNRAAPHRRR